jgi:hypothetical protein
LAKALALALALRFAAGFEVAALAFLASSFSAIFDSFNFSWSRRVSTLQGRKVWMAMWQKVNMIKPWSVTTFVDPDEAQLS